MSKVSKKKIEKPKEVKVIKSEKVEEPKEVKKELGCNPLGEPYVK